MNTNHGIRTRYKYAHGFSKVKQPRKQKKYSHYLWAQYTSASFDKKQTNKVAKYLARCVKGAKS